MTTDSDTTKERVRQLIEENRQLVQRCLELEAASRQQLEKLRAANAVLAGGEADLRSLLENAAVAFALADLNLRIASANRTMARIVGYAPAELSGVNFTNLVYVGKLPAFNRLLGAGGGAPGEEMIELVARDGSLVPCRISATPWLDEAGAARGHFILVFDAGPEMAAAGRLRDMERSVAEGEKSRGLFMEVVSREMRAPASAVVGMSRMLMDAGLTPRQAELAGVIHSSAGMLVRLVDDLVDVAAGVGDAARPEPSAPGDIAVGAVNFFGCRAEEKGLKLSLAVSPAVPNRVMLDPHLLRRVLAHLLDNSVKFTEHGRVTLAVDIVDSRIRFMVSDTGPGVPQEARDGLFRGDVFPHGAGGLRYGGMGMGLAICRRLAAAMGGALGYESEPGRGSEFHFSLPLVPALPNSDTRRLEAPAEAVRLPPLSILVADANPISSRFILACLRFDGHAVTVTDSGVDAAEKCRDNRYDLVVLDSLLPKLDGLQTLRLIRGNEKATPGRRTPALIMTSAGPAAGGDAFLRAGADGAVAKPLDTVRFMNALAKAAGVKPLAVSRARPPAQYDAGAEGGALRRLDGNQLVNLSQSMPKSQFAGVLRHFMDDAVPGLLLLEKRAGEAEPDHERIAFAAAKGRGLAGYLGFAALADVLKKLEKASRAYAPGAELLRIAGDIGPTVDDSFEEMRRILPETFALISDMREPMEE